MKRLGVNSEYVTQTQRRAALLDVRGARVRLRGNDAENCSAIVRAGRPRVCALNRGRHLKVGILFIHMYPRTLACMNSLFEDRHKNPS